MKPFLKAISLLAWFFATISLHAQPSGVTAGKLRTEDNQEIDAWTVRVETPPDLATKSWAAFVQSTYGVKAGKRTKTVWAAPKVKLETVSPLPGDLRASFEPAGDETSVAFSFSPGYSIHLGTAAYPEEFAKLQGVLRQFVKYHYLDHYGRQAAKTAKQLAQKKSRLARYQQQVRKLDESLASNQQKITDGAPKAAKLTSRNDQYRAKSTKLTGSIAQLEKEIVELQSSLQVANDIQKKVYDF